MTSGPSAAKRARTDATSSNLQSSSSSALKISITIDPSIADSQSDLPVTYTLEAMTKKTPGALHPFTRSADGGVLVIHGKISRTASAQVAHGITDPTSSSSGTVVGKDDGRFRTLLRNRLLDTTVNSKRFVQPGGDAGIDRYYLKYQYCRRGGWGGLRNLNATHTNLTTLQQMLLKVVAMNVYGFSCLEKQSPFINHKVALGPPFTETVSFPTLLNSISNSKILPSNGSIFPISLLLVSPAAPSCI